VEAAPRPAPRPAPRTITAPRKSAPAPESQQEPAAAPAAYYANCTAAKRAGAAPLYRGQPGYRAALDRDGDGVACET
jgi:hypothetical protein